MRIIFGVSLSSIFSGFRSVWIIEHRCPTGENTTPADSDLASLDTTMATPRPDEVIDEAVQDRIMKPSHYMWVEAGKKISIKNMDSKAANFVLLQFK